LCVFRDFCALRTTDRRKLSKRDGASTVEAFRAQGNLPEALLNFVGLLGWNPGTEQELMTLEQMAALFDFERVQRGGAVVDYDRLRWMNQKYMRERVRTRLPEFLQLVRPLILAAFPAADVSDDFLARVVRMHEDRLHALPDIVHVAAVFFAEPRLDAPELADARAKVWTARADAKVAAGKSAPSGMSRLTCGF
jgi:nondiscriminating glutamyl-tRNA synthetase